MANLKNVNRPKATPESVLNKRLGVGPAEYQTIKRGKEAIGDTGGRVFKGAVTGKMGQSSIIGMAKDNIFEFPVFVSDTVPLEYATATNTLLEQVYASYLQMALSLHPIASAKEIKNGSHFSQFKTNTTKYVECVDLSFQKDACHSVFQNDEMTMEFTLAAIEDSDAKFLNEYMAHEPLSEFSHYFQEETTKSAKEEKEEKASEKLAQIMRETSAALDAMNAAQAEYDEIVKALPNAVGPEREVLTNRFNQAKQTCEAKQREFENIKAKYATAHDDPVMNTPEFKKMRDEINTKARQLEKIEKEIIDMGIKHERDAESDKRAREKHMYDTKPKAPQQIDETKLNKLNTMKPLMMVVNLNVMDKDGGLSQPVEYMVGVKTHCRIIDSDTLPEVVKYPVQEMDKVARKAKWKAGELKFFKDILFDVKGKKQTAVDSQDPKRKWYRRLYQLSHMQGDSHVARNLTGKTFAGGSKGLIPNTTLIITQNDVDHIEDVVGIDIMKPSNAIGFCKELFMMGLVVIDQDSSSIKMLFPDINNDFEVQSLAAIEKQIAQLDTAGVTTRELFKTLR